MAPLSDLLGPDFSSYYTATGTLGFVLTVAGFTTLGRTYVILPYQILYPLIGLIGIGLIAHAVLGLRRDKIRRDQRQDRLVDSVEDYQGTLSENPELADIASEEEELPQDTPEQQSGQS